METKYCPRCREVKPLEVFALSKATNDGRQGICKSCKAVYSKAWRQANKEHRNSYQKVWVRRNPKKNRKANRASVLKTLFNLPAEAHNAMLAAQGGVCAICKQLCVTGKSLAVDHDRRCCDGRKSCGKCVRGLLCYNCNTSLGKFRDSAELLQAAITYLQAYADRSAQQV